MSLAMLDISRLTYSIISRKKKSRMLASIKTTERNGGVLARSLDHKTRTRSECELAQTIGIDVWEEASGASHDAPRFGLKRNSVSNARKQVRSNKDVSKKFMF